MVQLPRLSFMLPTCRYWWHTLTGWPESPTQITTEDALVCQEIQHKIQIPDYWSYINHWTVCNKQPTCHGMLLISSTIQKCFRHSLETTPPHTFMLTYNKWLSYSRETALQGGSVMANSGR